MAFLDLNIPYLEGGGSEKPLPNKKNARLKFVVKAMELGYTGVAYNRSIKGVMSDADRCTISLFPLSSLLKLAPTLSTSVKFHRELLGVPLNSPFRQYTRLTVAVDSLVHAAALNSGNPVLKTYDLVAVRPLNQTAFDQTCKVSEVDLIAIDFSEKLPFRLKLPMIKAALERGIYFEITYSHLISDVQARRQMVSNAKLLVDWTRGKNLIFSSAASSVNELRGPYDVANLSSLLSLPMERAKAAISKNGRSLMVSALRKKHYYKEAIRVERISPGEQLDSKEPWFGDWNSWDHISSGEGDLLLDDIAKYFSASSKVPKTSKAIDFASIAEEMPSKGMQLKDWLSGGGGELQPPDNMPSFLSAAKELGESDATNEVFKLSNEYDVAPFVDRMSLASTPSKHQTLGCEGLLEAMSPNDPPSVFTNPKNIETPTTSREEPKSSDRLDAVSVAVGIIPHDTQSQDWVSSCEGDLVLPDDTVTLLTSAKDFEPSHVCNADPKGSRLDVFSLPEDHVSTIEGDLVSPMDTLGLSTPSKEIDLPFSWNEDSKRLNGLDVFSGACDVTMKEVLTETEERVKMDLVSTESSMYLHGDFAKREQHGQHGDDAIPLADENSIDEMQGDVVLVTDDVQPEEALVELEEQKQEGFIESHSPALDESKSGKAKCKQRTPLRAFPFPFKHLLKPVLFKKKSRKLKN